MSPRLPACTPRDLERVLLAIGFVATRQSGSHRIYLRLSDQRRVVLPIHARDLKPGLLHQLIKDAGLTPDEFHGLLITKRKRRRSASR